MKRETLINLILCAGVSLLGISALISLFSILKRPQLADPRSEFRFAAHEGRLTKEQITELRQEFANNFEFTDISFEEMPYRGKYVNKQSDGSRLSSFNSSCNQTPRERIVWVFGGSTTYGYGVPDNQTIPSKLANVLHVRSGETWCVKNYARGYYYSSQELSLFVALLRESPTPPGSVVFIDGLNDFYHLSGPSFTPESQFKKQGIIISSALTFAEIYLKLIGRVQRLLDPGLSNANPHVFGVYRVIGVKPTLPRQCGGLIVGAVTSLNLIGECRPFLRLAASRLLRNWEIASDLSSSVGAKFVPVLQPVPAYPHSARDLNPFISAKGLSQHELSGHGYPLILPLLGNQLDLSDLFLGNRENDEQPCDSLYVDPVHYTGCSSGLIAEKIANRVFE